MTKLLRTGLLAATVLIATSWASAQDLPYTEGTVTEVTYIKIKPGMFDAYMKWLATDRKRLMDEYKKAGLILDTNVYSSVARSPHEADLILTVTYKNMGALDGLQAKQEAISSRIMGPRDKANEAAVGRESMREVLGSELIRELVLR